MSDEKTPTLEERRAMHALHAQQPDRECIDCVGNEVFRLKKILSIIVYLRQHGKVVVGEDEIERLPEGLDVRDYYSPMTKSFVIEVRNGDTPNNGQSG